MRPLRPIVNALKDACDDGGFEEVSLHGAETATGGGGCGGDDDTGGDGAVTPVNEWAQFDDFDRQYPMKR